ncbi:hypothetical protein FACS189481_3540 [Clostridia bacterium]|nr:hypothetical protein FACS189481_3540 [Clostridia bacterium]
MGVVIGSNHPPVPASASEKSKAGGSAQKIAAGASGGNGAVIVELSGDYQKHVEIVREAAKKIKKEIEQPTNKEKLRFLKEEYEAGTLSPVNCKELARDMINLA